jgi:hypothetical protein
VLAVVVVVAVSLAVFVAWAEVAAVEMVLTIRLLAETEKQTLEVAEAVAPTLVLLVQAVLVLSSCVTQPPGALPLQAPWFLRRPLCLGRR